jgi:hypothetical protein
VVLPSPAPFVVPITENKSAYVARLTAAPLHISQPLGAVAVCHNIIAPVGEFKTTVVAVPEIKSTPPPVRRHKSTIKRYQDFDIKPPLSITGSDDFGGDTVILLVI